MKKTTFYFLIILLSLLLVSCKKVYYTITFEDNDTTISSLEVSKAEEIIFPNLDDGYKRIKYWTIKGQSKVFDNNSILDCNLTLTPFFEYANVVTFVNTNVKDAYVFPGEKVKKPQDPTLANYTFIGWYKDYERTIPFNFDKVYSYVQFINVYPKWEESQESLYYRGMVIDGELIYEVYIKEDVFGEVIVPSHYLGVKIYEVYQLGYSNNATIISLPETILNALPDFFISSNNLEEIKVDSRNKIYQAVEGVLYRNPDTIVFYPSNKKGDTHYSDAIHIGIKSFSNTRNLKNLFLNKAFQISKDAFSFSSIENIVVAKGAYIDLNAFRNYKGNVFLYDETYDFLSTDNVKVYVKSEWSLVNGYPVPNN